MKKLIILILFVALPLLAEAQLSGSGTYNDPWNGTLNGDATWSGTVYINGDIIVDNEKLTINAGTNVIFLAEGADLIITGTGQLEADGTAENMIRFTADDDDDGTYGESGERWGHISFQSMGVAGASLFDYCIIEYGNVKNLTGASGYGGGIHTDFSDLAISNCIFRYNIAEWGGGIFINKGESPVISSCLFLENESDNGGGGIYCWDNTASIIINCIFDSNIAGYGTTSANYSGGGISLQTNTGIQSDQVINCTFVNNDSNHAGDALQFYSGGSKKAVNCIFWGSNSQIAGGSSTRLINCAIQGSTTGTNTINLNSLNSATNGPNFNAIDGSDWSITFISPCRDAGTTPSPAVPNDYEGNPRIGPYDIGAYEVQYSRWSGSSSTDWGTAGNWESGINPTSGTENVVIPAGLSNYPVSSSNPDFTIGTDKQMIVGSGARVTLANLTNNGILKLNHNASGFASLIVDSYSRGSGATEEIQLYLTGGGDPWLEDYRWHYISSPVSSISTGVFTGVTLDLAQFIESRVSTSLLQGWVAFDGYVYATGATTGPTFSSLTPGKGYNYWDGLNNTFTFGGILNTSDLSMPLSYSGIPSQHGFNLLGNPFSSGLNWDEITSGTYFPYPAYTSKGLYFTRNNEQCSYIAGVGTPFGVSGIIPPMQGFFTKTYTTGNSITIPAAARTHDDIHPRYKGTTIIPLVRLALANDTASFDETVVRFDEQAKADLDIDFDALKMFISTEKNQVYTSIDGIAYSINGQPFPENSVTIPVVSNITVSGTYKISTTQLQGLDGYNVLLSDKLTGFTADLKTTPELLFSSEAGTFTDRFALIFSITTGIEKPVSSKDQFNIYTQNGLINIIPINEEWSGKTGSVNLLNLTGKSAGSLNSVEFQNNTPVQIQAPAAKGMYVVEIRSGMKRYAGKVVIR